MTLENRSPYAAFVKRSLRNLLRVRRVQDLAVNIYCESPNDDNWARLQKANKLAEKCRNKHEIETKNHQEWLAIELLKMLP